MNWLTKLSLRDTLLIIGVLPAALLAILLSLFFTQTLIATIEQDLSKQGNSLANNLANNAVFAMFTRDTDQLTDLLEIAVQNPDVLAAKVLDTNQQVIAASKSSQQLSPLQRLKSRQFSVPIQSKRFAQNDEIGELLMEQTNNAPPALGTFVLTLSTAEAIEYKNNMVLNSFFITLFGLLVIGLIAVNLSRSIRQPILEIASDVERIAAGDYRPSDPLKSENELGTLSLGIKSMAKQLETHHHDLETKIQLATKRLALQNKDLQKARQEAERASQLKSSFLSQMSHEIRTPMNGIIGFLELLRDTGLNEQQLLYLETAKHSSHNLLRIINEVLELSRFEAGKFEIISKDFDLGNTIRECIDLLTPQAKQRFVHIQLEPARNLPKHIHQDPVRLTQVLINLLSNAIKFSYQSDVTLTIEPDPDSPNDSLLFAVSDRGCGIQPEHLKHLFDPFTQYSADKMHQGSGLGLAISKQIIDTLGGTIAVDSTANQGSTFWFTLPFKPAQAPSEVFENELIRHKIDLTGKKILVADDNEINRLLLSLLLEKTGAQVVQATDGEQAVSLANHKPFDMLMLDIIMPKQSGTEALKSIRSSENNPNRHTPAIAITALPTQELQEDLLTANFQHFLAKPIFEKELGSILMQFFQSTDQSVVTTLPTTLGIEAQPDGPIDQALDFDIELALKQMNGNNKVLNKMLAQLIEEIPVQLTDAQRLIDQGKFGEAAHYVHKMHGSAAYCGTPRLKQAAKAVELQLNQSKPTNLQATMDELTKSVHRLVEQQHRGLLK